MTDMCRCHNNNAMIIIGIIVLTQYGPLFCYHYDHYIRTYHKNHYDTIRIVCEAGWTKHILVTCMS